MKTLETLEVGDYVKSKVGNYCRVLAVLGGEGELRVYAISSLNEDYSHDNLKMYYSGFTAYDLKTGGYAPYNPSEEITELTVAEAAKRLGVKNLKIVE